VTSKRAVAAAAFAVLVTACSSTSSSSTSSVPSVAMCRTGGLRISVDSTQADGAAGSTYYPIDFTNTAAAACTLDGYPGVSFVAATDSSGHQIGAAAQRNPEFGPDRVRLEPGGEAHAWLQVGAAGNYPDSTCQPVTALGLRVYPPGETQAGYVRQDIPACASATAQLLTIMPVRVGKGRAGSAP
jgi:hypothetical protein